MNRLVILLLNDLERIGCTQFNGLSNTNHHHHHHHHHVVPLARISLTPFSLLLPIVHRLWKVFRATSRILTSCWRYVRAGRPAFARPYVGVHRSTSLMSSSLLLLQWPSCLVRLTWIVFEMGGRWPYSWRLVGVLPPGPVQYCSQHSCVIAV